MHVSFKAARGLLGSMLATLLLLALATLLLGSRPANGQGGGLLIAGGPGIDLAARAGAAAAPSEVSPPPEPAPAAPVAAGHASLLPRPFQITSEFGHYPDGKAHYGLDIGATEGVEQYAPVGGTVEEVLRGCVFGDTTCGRGWGNHVWWQSDETGHHLLLGHFNEIDDAIQVGAHIAAGQLIGYTGSTGYTMSNGRVGYGPHVHLQVNTDHCCDNVGATNPAWELYWLRVDPEPVLGARFGACDPAPCK